MPSQHIKEDTWRKVEKETIRAIIQTKTNIRTTEMLDLLIRKGLEVIDEIDFDKLAKNKNK